ncbi:MAG: hypothetical protein K6E20_06500 [Acholeplasmatales bacterium]|nr:hypothetical protein [Acholeplasmatales bacterium]
MNNIYVYDTSLKKDDYNLPSNILDHTNQYKNDSKREISMMMYYLLGIKLRNIGFSLENLYFFNNKPLIDGINISLSHTDSYIAIMISDEKCGIDIEKIITKNVNKLSELICKNDYDKYLNSIDKNLYLTQRWTSLEAQYKCNNEKGFFDMFSDEFPYKTLKIKEYVLSYVGKCDNIYLNDKLYRV